MIGVVAGGARVNRFGDGLLWDRHGAGWRRVEDWVEPDRVRSLIDDHTGWLIEWCEGEFQWGDSEADVALLESEVLPSLLTRKRAQRLLARKRAKPTVFVAEMWRNDEGIELLLFNETAPAPRAASWFA